MVDEDIVGEGEVRAGRRYHALSSFMTSTNTVQTNSSCKNKQINVCFSQTQGSEGDEEEEKGGEGQGGART